MSQLKSHVVRGTRFAVAGRLLRALVGIATLSILSRHLTPQEFGIMALVAFVAAFAQILADFGTRVAIVQRRDVTKLQEDSVFWTNTAIGAAIMVLILVFAEQISWLLGSDSMAGPLRWVSPIFLMGGLQGVPLSVLERSFAFGRLAVAETLGAFSGAATAVVLVLAGWDVGALVAQQLVITFLTGGLYIVFSRWRPGLRYSRAALKPLVDYGSYVTMTNIVQFFGTQSDRPIIGRRLSPADLGYISMAEQIVLSPLRIVAQMVRKVMFPVMSSIQNDDMRLRRGFLGVQHAQLFVLAPLTAGLWAIAVPAVELLLGPKWQMVAVLMGFITVRATVNTLNSFSAALLAAKGRARFQFAWSLCSLVLTVITLLAAAPYGVVVLAAARMVQTLAVTPVFLHFTLRSIGQGYSEFFAVIVRPILSSVVMAIGVTLLLKVLPFDAVGQLIVAVPFGAAVYGVMELSIDRERVLPLLRQTLSRGRKAGQAQF